MPTRYTKRGELQQFQYEIANEIKRDAKPIADGVFGNNALHPDMASVSNAEMDRIYRDAYARDDREWLMQEAQRDPQQFLDVTDRIGVPDPPTDMRGKPTGPDPNALQQALQNAAQAAPPPSPGVAGVGVPSASAAPMPAALPPAPTIVVPPPGTPVAAGAALPVPMASGGIVTQPTLALIGERGPEAVVPLTDVTSGNYPGTMPRMPNVQVDASSPDAFIRSVTPAARYVEAQTGIPAAAMVAMAANETGYGKYAAGNNLFGIKGQGPAGSVNARTWEDYGRGAVTINDQFRAYNNPTESYTDFVDFLRGNSNYAPLMSQVTPGGGMSPTQFVQGLKDAHYMTDPNYVSKIISLIRQWQPTMDQTA
jgi:hypothetical protein